MQIAVVGCGWLGLPLAISLKKRGDSIVATRRSEAGCSQLSSLGFICVQFELGATLTQEKFAPIFNCDLLVLNIPVDRKTASSEEFSANIDDFLRQAVDSNIKRVIFISTTSVFGDQNSIVTEKSATTPKTQSGEINLAIEQLVLQYFAEQVCIIRLSGLVGEERHPVHFLAGKTELAAPNKVVNLIHQHDVIQCIESIINNETWGHVLVLSALEHPTRKDYYTWAAKKLNLTAPLFVEELGQPSGKLIDASTSLEMLGVHLKYPSPYDMLN
jgi:nucleoside-diphosphate-sugar epimerase